MDDVFWIEGDEAIRLAIVLRPRGGDWLEADLRRYKLAGLETLVSLIEDHEAEFLELTAEGPVAESIGMEFLPFPIQDVRVPMDLRRFNEFVRGLADRLKAGEAIGLHCRGSIGRAPLTAACTLITLGWGAEEALEAIREARGCIIPDTVEQLAWILKYEAAP